VLLAGGIEYPASVLGDNPVRLFVDHDFTIEPGAADTVLLAVDIAPAAPPGEIRLNLARSGDVVFSIGETEPGPRMGVVWQDDGSDIAEHFRSGPLSIMSERFEEYVHNYPNPFRAGSETTKISYYLTEDSDVTIDIYDLLGSLVWSKIIRAGEPGGTGTAEKTWWEVEWNGRNGRGELVRNGVYLCKVNAGSRSAMFKIAVAK
jgi:hypothetical protein